MNLERDIDSFLGAYRKMLDISWREEVHPNQLYCLMYLGYTGQKAVSIGALTEGMGILSQSSVSEHVQRLKEKGLLKNNRTKDGRLHLVSLSPAGVALYDRITELKRVIKD